MKQAFAALAVCLLTLSAVSCATVETAGDEMDEAALAARVEARLAADPEVSAFDIGVDVEGRVVTLTGEVDTAEAAAEAVELAGDTSGIQGVINRLEVPMTMEETDAAITAEVRERLDDQLGGAAIRVETEGGFVTLRGTVASAEVREKAVSVTRGVDGVSGVRNALRVGQP